MIGVPNDPVQRRPCAARPAERGRDQAEGRHRHPRDRSPTSSKIRRRSRSRNSTPASSAAAIEDLDAAVVNTDWALKSGLSPDEPHRPGAGRRQSLPQLHRRQGRQRERRLGEDAGLFLSERRRQGRVRQGLQGHRHQRLLISARAWRNGGAEQGGPASIARAAYAFCGSTRQEWP